MTRRFLAPALLAACLASGFAAAEARAPVAEARALADAKREAGEANARSEALERAATRAEGEAERARAATNAAAARIEAAEADITAAEARIRIVNALRAAQRARLAERQQPVVRLTAALQTMARRPAALAMVQPGTLDELVRVRALLASTLPEIRARTADLRAEIADADRLARQSDAARAALVHSREALLERRLAFARLEESQRRRSQSLADSALIESDRALAFGEEARDIAERMDSLEHQARVRRALAALPAPLPRPGDAPPARAAAAPPRYILPVRGRLVTGMGEISDAGVHARGLTFEAAPGTPVVAPRAGRVVYAGPFRSYGRIVIIDHGGGWTTLVTSLESLAAKQGDEVARGTLLGRTAPQRSRVTVELRRQGHPIPITPLL